MTAIDRAAEALLSAALEAAAGDVMVALAQLCAPLSVGDVEGETYQAALERMISRHFRSTRLAICGVGSPRDEGA
ncbi:hypothetical protein OPKNFCMD_3813 [Methylobacterium crusticola]|uniref:Uncharacterized protein n=1 Tax=Methylobacterium crusticola TaxID=1697972 RepID=A0ABQ4R0T6_9HYPH|nr:hypothetical protein [Methylobacterium crusticola]GJD51062.1 hypothetical protein OPKNFCMD_3813 [Methylobacterium crusticola]